MTTGGEAAKRSIAGVFDRASAYYDRTGVDFFRPVGRTLVELAGIRAGERVLELGSGRGAATFPAAEAVGPTGVVRAVDLAEGMVSQLRADVAAAGLDQVTCEVGDAEQPAAAAGEWDVVLASLVLFFLPDHQRAMRGYRDLLRPGGRLAFSWFADDDDRWDPVFEALVAELPKETRGARRPGSGGPFEGPATMDAFLEAAGYTVTTTVRPITVGYADDDTWWATLWSHGRRATMERLRDEGVLESTRGRVGTALEAIRLDDRSLVWTPRIAYTVARRA